MKSNTTLWREHSTEQSYMFRLLEAIFRIWFKIECVIYNALKWQDLVYIKC